MYLLDQLTAIDRLSDLQEKVKAIFIKICEFSQKKGVKINEEEASYLHFILEELNYSNKNEVIKWAKKQLPRYYQLYIEDFDNFRKAYCEYEEQKDAVFQSSYLRSQILNYATMVSIRFLTIIDDISKVSKRREKYGTICN
jgi:hypothetical protein